MEINDMLSSLLSDPEKLQGALSMASSLLGGTGAGAPTPNATEETSSMQPPPSTPDSPPSQAAPPLSDIASAFSAATQSKASSNEYDPSAELVQKAMPMLNTLLRSGQNAVSPNKVHLLNAIKPFVNTSVSGQFDHAMRLVSVARIARNAMRQMNQPSGNTTDTKEV